MALSKNNKQVFMIMNLIVQFFVETFVGTALGYFMGKYLDQWLFEDRQIFTYLLMFLGMMSGLVNLIRRVMKNVNGGEPDEKKEEHH